MSPPSAFGPYRVLHQIGSGVLGPVFRAYDSQQDRLVAIKTFRLDLVPEAASRLAERLRALAAARPAHPAIVGAVDAGLSGATPFVALEYASGEPLDALVRQSGAWPVARALPVLREIAAAIDASWASSVGHGALHPRDIFVDAGSAEVRVTGFGIGQALDDTGVRAPVRRPYAAPERGEGGPWDIRADIYSLGVVAFELTSGQRPVGPDDEGETLASELSADARAAIRRVLAVATADQAADRHESAGAFVDALAGAAQPARAPAPVEIESVTVSADVAQASEPAPEPVGEATALANSDTDAPEEELPAPRRARIKRVRPIALDLPLLDGADQPAEVPVDASGAEVTPEPAFASMPATVEQPASAADQPEVVIAADPGPDRAADSASESGREPVPEPRLSDVPIEPDATPRASPRIDFGRSIVRDEAADADAPVAAFPWVALTAVFAAGLVLGGVVMYQWGWRRGSDSARQAAAAPAVAAPSVQPLASATPPPAAKLPAKASPALRPTASPEAAAMGRLVVQSVPAGALVTIDGRRVGETPVTVPVPLGRHDVQVARPGYAPYNERIELTKRSASRTLRVQLKRGAGGTSADARR